MSRAQAFKASRALSLGVGVACVSVQRRQVTQLPQIAKIVVDRRQHSGAQRANPQQLHLRLGKFRCRRRLRYASFLRQPVRA
jgi:hypothetical protein